MTDNSERVEAMLQAMSFMIQDLYVQAYANKPAELKSCSIRIKDHLQHKWHLLPNLPKEQSELMSRVQPKAVAELDRLFGEIRKMIAALPPAGTQ
ncbi:hypothetical protein [Pseudomonas tohonis]|uniref:hypothetical protein n=1 Tax=Pseudomonas tohonis TaxID=2725477 RepID=UPI0021D8ABA2|nr:hypothetical protein [Pseudomonas tohonis]UXY55397.1 hypothetical protein N9L84_12760 [Pseudomonas tohonis]